MHTKSWRRAHFEREGENFKGKGKGHSSIQVGKGSWNINGKFKLKEKDQDKDKQARGRRLTKDRGALLHKACGKVFEELQGIREWLLLYQVHLFMFPVLYILL